jgi:hypothetical protein
MRLDWSGSLTGGRNLWQRSNRGPIPLKSLRACIVIADAGILRRRFRFMEWRILEAAPA